MSIGVYLYYYWKTRKSDPLEAFFPLIVLLLIFFSVLTSVLLNQLGAKYPSGRTALFFVPLLSCLFIYLLHCLPAIQFKSVGSIAASILTFAIAVLMSLHLLNSFNLSYTLNWKHHANTKAVLVDLTNLRKNNPSEEARESIDLVVARTYYFPLTYYTQTREKWSWLNLHWVEDQQTWLQAVQPENYDYYYFSTPDPNFANQDKIVLVKQYETSGAILATNKSKK
ncbi:MAG: hypothetical protein F6K03_06620 [Kamptonema sp. SIO4C4]|nr:hypothetical protein [Kamptonema sp. SIO4C4]